MTYLLSVYCILQYPKASSPGGHLPKKMVQNFQTNLAARSCFDNVILKS